MSKPIYRLLDDNKEARKRKRVESRLARQETEAKRMLAKQLKSKSKLAKPVTIDKRHFSSIRAAARAIGVSPETIKHRIDRMWRGYSYYEDPGPVIDLWHWRGSLG